MGTEQIAQKLRTNLEYYAKKILHIKTKSGNIVPFELNKAQIDLDNKLESLRRERGYIRAIVLKARQLGFTTYIGGRFFRNVVMNSGKSGYILSHESSSTTRIFDMVKMFWELSPEEIRPSVKRSNRNELIFDNLYSRYEVGTAGNENIGVGGTIQYLHWSEVSRCERAYEINAGLLQSMALMEGTECILESTAKGNNGFFYDVCQDALSKRGEYSLYFYGWNWDDGYQLEVPKDYEFSKDDKEYGELFKLNNKQLFWRRRKIEEFRGDEVLFKREYPLSIEEAFLSKEGMLFDIYKIKEAMNRVKIIGDEDNSKLYPLLLGVDPAREKTGDRTILALRRGKDFIKYITYYTGDVMQIAGIIVNTINKYGVDKFFIDYGGQGAAIFDRIRELGYRQGVLIPFNMGAINPIYFNKRAEMYGEVKEWLEEGFCKIPKSEELEREFAIIPQFKERSNGKYLLPSKAEIKETYKKSPDILDAFALTFAMPVSMQYKYKNNLKNNIDNIENQTININKRNKDLCIDYRT